MVVGVNGAGKTTTIRQTGCAARQRRAEGLDRRGDTFRAAAIDQLQVWADRAGATMIRQQMGSDPASVAFDTLTSAKANGADVVLIDTAGRLHNKVGLMNELTKIRNVMGKGDSRRAARGDARARRIDGTERLRAGREFTRATKVTSLTITKLDGTAKGRRGDRHQRPVPHPRALHRHRRGHRPAAHLRPPGVRQRIVRR